MSEWNSVLAVFWLLWALDGARLAPWRSFTVVGGARARWRTRIRYSRLSWPSVWPGSWRTTTTDVPLSLSPAGICNRPAGSTGRPVETAVNAQAWRWEELREVGVARGWVYVNGARFCANTGHVRAPELLELAALAPLARERRIATLIRGWLRPENFLRRVRILERRTGLPARLNAISVTSLSALTIYVVADVASKLPGRGSERITEAVPWVLAGLLTLHIAAVVMTWRAVRCLKAVSAEKRGSALFSALLLPPQALRLRALAADGYFPAQHPLAAVLAFGASREQEQWAFNTLADLRWPIEDAGASPLAREITGWYRNALEAQLLPLFQTAKIAPDTLLAPPPPDVPVSCSYCPRCRDQFVDGRSFCPNGVRLRPLARR